MEKRVFRMVMLFVQDMGMNFQDSNCTIFVHSAYILNFLFS